jgi:UDP-N-acetylmuramyl pentapeptide phosphotransferase/UDP-N-acetylglucosamine-1-phosphate transferase
MAPAGGPERPTDQPGRRCPYPVGEPGSIVELSLIIIEPVRLMLVATAGFLVALAGTGLLVHYLTQRRVFDEPNERSSHSVPTPRGGGIAVLGAIAVAWLIGLTQSAGDTANDLVILAAAAALGFVCFIDDLRGLRALPRLLAQCGAVAPGLWLSAGRGGLFADLLPLALDLAATGFLWLWFINLFNFMDGIDGITGVEIAMIGVGLTGLAATGMVPLTLLDPAIALTAAALGFLVWNWCPARIFMGDVGSIPVGYLIGWLLISAAQGSPGQNGGMRVEAGEGLAICLILPAYYLADATITLVRRLVKRENVFQAHRQHFYQQAIIRGLGHATVCRAIILANAGLIATAWFLGPQHPGPALALSAMIVLVLLLWMAGWLAAPAKPSEAR